MAAIFLMDQDKMNFFCKGSNICYLYQRTNHLKLWLQRSFGQSETRIPHGCHVFCQMMTFKKYDFKENNKSFASSKTKSGLGEIQLITVY